MEHVHSDGRLIFPATERNRNSIADVLRSYIPNEGIILEIASGSGEHGVYFQELFPTIIWQASDPEIEHRKSIHSWISHKKLCSTMPYPLDIDVKKKPWPISNHLRYLIKGIVCINMIHISPWSCAEALFEGSKSLLSSNKFLMIYGPFFRKDKYIAESNINFDHFLKLQNPLWGIRDLDRINDLASQNGFVQNKIVEMPANNLSVIYLAK
tara:strand:- start:714 stop:1346 length:633 start_codon:yes stop_codon:yes gene_type:complete